LALGLAACGGSGAQSDAAGPDAPFLDRPPTVDAPTTDAAAFDGPGYDAPLDAAPADGARDGGSADAPAGPLHVIGFGDSVTVGFCASPGDDYISLLVRNDDTRYPDFAGRDLASHFASVTVNNAAHNGWTSCSYSVAMINDLLAADPLVTQPTIVLITLGGNDLIHDYNCTAPHECATYCATLAQATPWAANFRTRMDGFINAFKTAVPSAHIFLANIYDPSDGVGDAANAPIPLPPWPDFEAILALYNQTLAQIATDTGATLVDLHTPLLGHGYHYDDPQNAYYHPADPTYWYCSNLEDPNDRGYRGIRAAFWAAIAPVLGL
jgi:lysophospholipase L1-like esterase